MIVLESRIVGLNALAMKIPEVQQRIQNAHIN